MLLINGQNCPWMKRKLWGPQKTSHGHCTRSGAVCIKKCQTNDPLHGRLMNTTMSIPWLLYNQQALNYAGTCEVFLVHQTEHKWGLDKLSYQWSIPAIHYIIMDLDPCERAFIGLTYSNRWLNYSRSAQNLDSITSA